QQVPFRLHALPDTLGQNGKLAGRHLAVAALRGSEHWTLWERLGLLLERYRRSRCALVRHLVQQRGDFLRIEFLLGLGFLALFLLLALALELRLLASFFLLKLPFELGLFALLFEPPLLFDLLLLLELSLLLGLALLLLQQFIELLLLVRVGRRRDGGRCGWRRRGHLLLGLFFRLLLGLFLGLLLGLCLGLLLGRLRLWRRRRGGGHWGRLGGLLLGGLRLGWLLGPRPKALVGARPPAPAGCEAGVPEVHRGGLR